MFDHIFENRDKKVTNIVKLSDYLGRSLRENIEIFSIDDSENKVTFITESGKIIAGSYDFDKSITLKDIQIEEGDLFENNDQFDEFVDFKISNFIENIFEEDYTGADTSFSKVLQLWESRVKFSTVKKKLYEKSQKFNGTNRILETEQFQKLVEIAPQLVAFLSENKNLINIPEIKNMVRLSSSVSKAFNLPKMSVDSLQESSYSIPEVVNHSIYDMICKQELIRKELVESKNNFDLVWLNNDKISTLASMVYEQDEQAIVNGLVDSVCEIPYLALATKKQITDTLLSNLELNESIKVNLKDVKAFSSLLFEYKKPLKKLFISMLNEKYGISVQNMKDIPTFKSLLNTQVLIFEALAKLTPKGSVVKEVLLETSQMLKTKNGVESIDVNHFIELLFEKSQYTDILGEAALIDPISIQETFSEIESVEELVSLVLEKKKLTKKQRKVMDTDKDGKITKKDFPINQETELNDEDRVDEEPVEEDGTYGYDKKGRSLNPKDKKKRKGIKEAEAAAPPDEKEAPEEEKVEKEEEASSEEKDKTEIPSSDEIMKSFKSFEDILNSIDFESLGGDEKEEEESEEASEKEAEVDKKEEGEE